MRYAEVAVDIPGVRARTFTYSIPEGASVAPGHAVWAPFGRRIRRGLVFSIADATDLAETRDVGRLLSETPLLSPAQLEVARWIASYYRVGLFTAASQMLPPGLADAPRTHVSAIPAAGRAAEATADVGPRARRAIETARAAGRIRRDRLGRSLGRGGTAVVDGLVRRGLLAAETVWERPATRPAYRNFVRLLAPAERSDAVAREQRSQRRAALVRFLSVHPEGVPRPQLTRRFGASAVRGLIERGFALLERRAVSRDPLQGRSFQRSFPLDPNADQAAAIGALTAAIEQCARAARGRPGGVVGQARRSARFLLFGVTGSGKTEVYLRAVQSCLDAGRTAIVLVPEIALTVQNVERFASRFGGKIALLHSGLPAGERFDQWWATRRGEYSIVIGSRGAVFAPLHNVGLVVIDEEHEWTYKQHDRAPRYHTRAVAEKLCEASGAVLLAGSATPDVETFRRAERGEFTLLTMPRRFETGARPLDRTSAGQANVQVVDMRAELRDGHTGLFSRPLAAAIRDALDAGGRVILFLNRRGAAWFVQCLECGYVRRCVRCETALTYHLGDGPRSPARLTCHYCNRGVRHTPVCRACGARRLRPMGAGTQRVAAEAGMLFPSAGVVRWDHDTARTARAHESLLRRFLDGPSRILVGTQMVAKGLDMPAVTLVGVVAADTGLSIPDFRAGERAFQVLTQVAGRAGRGRRGGRAIIQTFQPEHYAVAAAARQDYESFYRVELELRSRFANPPFSRLIRLGYADPSEETARSEAAGFARSLRHARAASGEGSTEVLGPSPSYPVRVRRRWRWHILLKGAAPSRLLERVVVPRGWTVDVDPIAVS